MDNRRVIAVAGASGSGKTTVADKLVSLLANALKISIDNFYKARLANNARLLTAIPDNTAVTRNYLDIYIENDKLYYGTVLLDNSVAREELSTSETGTEGTLKKASYDKLLAKLREQNASLEIDIDDDLKLELLQLATIKQHAIIEDRSKTNYDHPNSLDFQLAANLISALKNGHTVRIPVYDFNTHNRSREVLEITPGPETIIILEGILALHADELASAIDFGIYVNTDAELCYERRKARDIAERGRTVESVKAQWDTTVYPMFLEFVAPTMTKASCVLDNVAADANFNMDPVIATIQAELALKNTVANTWLDILDLPDGALKQSMFYRSRMPLESLTPVAQNNQIPSPRS